MRYAPEHKERVHRRILAEAAAAIRASGPERVSVARIMGKLGLTHGGFYSHFESKDDLVAQSIGCMFDQSYARFLRRTVDREPDEGLSEFIDGYLSPAHRDAPGRGCPLAFMAGEMPRMSPGARRRVTEGIDRLAGGIENLLIDLRKPNAKDLAYSALAEMTGALVLSRSTTDSRASDELLRVSRTMVKQRLGLVAAE